MSFNVLTDPWIPMADGEELPLLDALARADELEGVRCASPLETCAVYRLMTAFVMDALSLENREERMALLKRGRFDMAVISAYVKKCEGEGASFDLFDPVRPFMQAAPDPALDDEKKVKSAACMSLQLPSGNNHVFFDHSPEARFAPDEAVRHLLTAYLFCTAGAQGYPSSVNNTPCVYVLHHGDTLFETVVLSMVSIAECGNISYGVPAWRTDGRVVPKKEFADVAMLSALTWQPRRVTLIPEEDGTVTRVYWQQGHNFKGNPLWRDPHVPYRRTKTDDLVSLKPQAGRALWRDLGALVPSRDARYGKPPQIAESCPQNKPSYRFSAVGLVTSNASLVELVTEEVNLPTDILEDAMLGDMLREDIQLIEDCAQAFQFAAKDVEGGALVPLLLNTFFMMAHDYVFGQYLEQLSLCDDDESFLALRKSVHDETLKMMRNTFDKEKLRLGNDARMLKIQAEIWKTASAVYFKKRRERENGWQ